MTPLSSNTVNHVDPTPPTHHMNTDSRAGKRIRPTSPVDSTAADPTPNPGQTKKQPPTAATPASKRPNIERPLQPSVTPNQWDYLRSSTIATPEASGKPPLTNHLRLF